MNKYISVLTLLIVISFLFAGNIFALGLSVSPSNLEVTIDDGSVAREELVVENLSNDVSLMEVYVDEFEDIIKLEPASFVLESGESRVVNVVIETRDSSVISTNISVITRAMSDADFNPRGGIKIPVTITTIGESSSRLTASIGRFFESRDFSVTFITLIVILALATFIKLVSTRSFRR